MSKNLLPGILLRATEAEIASWSEAATKAGVNRTEWIKLACAKALKAKRRPRAS